jgi:ADP-ribosylglycohydrolase/fructose-1,6-bisphosphatase/inositol monophosphatase family enzyme
MSSPTSPDYHYALQLAIEAARRAGQMLREEFHRPGGPRGSRAHAEVDEQAERLIRQVLAAIPWGFRGEETGATPGVDHHHLWLIDPNDGTSAYLRGYRGPAVSIAALRDGVPILGVVHAYAYPDDNGDLIAWAEGCPLTRNGAVLRADLAPGTLVGGNGLPAIVFLSQDADTAAAANAALVRPARFIALPSIAYRLARVAVGDGVAAVSLSKPVGWDYAAGHALLRASGGVLVDERGAEVTYSTHGDSNTRWCFGGSPAAVAELARRDWKSVLGSARAVSSPLSLASPVPGRTVSDPGVLARAQGCLLGQLAGDSLGGLVEFRNPSEIVAAYPHGVRDMHDGGSWGNLAGQVTDDSEMALMLARTLVREQRYDPGTVLDAYVRWWAEAWDRGSTLAQALEPAGQGKTTAQRLQLAQQCASTASQSNGSLMRCSPLGIFTASRPERAGELARMDSRLTHPNRVCQDSCAVFVTALAQAILGVRPEAVYQAALTEAAKAGGPDKVFAALEQARHSPPPDYVTHMGWVLIALQNAFYQLLHAPSLEEGIVDTIRRGGDTDTTAAISGALLGAVHGRTAIPTRWLSALQSCRPLPDSGSRHVVRPEVWPVDALVLAEALLIAGRRDLENQATAVTR